MAKGTQNSDWSGFFRAFTVLCAILHLLARQGLELVQAGSGDWQVLSVYEGLTLWTVPALFLLWGMSALEEGRPQVSAAWTGLVLPALGMLLFWGVVFAVAAPLLEGQGGNFTLSGLIDILAQLSKGGAYGHLWVLYPLVGLYLVHPVLHRFASSASRGELCYFLGLCFLFASLLPLWTGVWPDSILAGLLERFQVQQVLGWAGCYVGGWYLRHFTIHRISEYILYLLGLLGLVLTVLAPDVGPLSPDLLRRYMAPNVLFTAAALCALFRYVLGISEERARRRAAAQIGACAFGAYLIHPLWVLVFQHFGITPAAFPPVLSIPLFALLVFLLSLPFAWLIRLIPGIGPRLT